MWLELVIDLFMPNKEVKTVDGLVKKSIGDTLPVWLRGDDSFKNALNDSDWLDDEVVSAGLLRQGKQPSLLGMMTGVALIEILRPRRFKDLPKEFTLAVTADRVVAFKMSPWTSGDDTTDYVVKIKREQVGSWPRASVRIVDDMLELAGTERFPVMNNADSSTGELLERLQG